MDPRADLRLAAADMSSVSMCVLVSNTLGPSAFIGLAFLPWSRLDVDRPLLHEHHSKAAGRTKTRTRGECLCVRASLGSTVASKFLRKGERCGGTCRSCRRPTHPSCIFASSLPFGTLRPHDAGPPTCRSATLGRPTGATASSSKSANSNVVEETALNRSLQSLWSLCEASLFGSFRVAIHGCGCIGCIGLVEIDANALVHQLHISAIQRVGGSQMVFRKHNLEKAIRRGGFLVVPVSKT